MADALAVMATQYSWISRADVIANAPVTLLFGPNPQRISLMFCNQGIDQVNIIFSPADHPQGSVIVYAGNTPTILLFRDLGALIQSQVFAFSAGTAGSANLSSFEMFKI